MKNKTVFFIYIPLIANALFIGFYFSGIESLQQIIVPSISFLSGNNWREFGLVEQVQNICLLITIVILIKTFIKKRKQIEKNVFAILALFFTFVFLEEIDYGLHFYELFSGANTDLKIRNIHNQHYNDRQIVEYLKQLIDFIMFLWFILLPVFITKFKNNILRCIIPLRWFIVGFIIAILFSRIAHLFEDMGYGIIANVEGNLAGNISEFRETNTYYFFMLYIWQLSNCNLYKQKRRYKKRYYRRKKKSK